MTIVRLAIALAILAIAAPVRAQSVEAEVLFREGKKLIKEGKLAEACDKFEASDRIESSAGTLLNLADCREKNHQLATAWVAFGKAAATAKRTGEPKREAEARRRQKLLEARLSYLTVHVADDAHLDGLQVARNGTALDPAVWNQSIPVDAGDYEIVAQAPGRTRWSKRVKIAGEGETATIDVPKLETPGAKPPEKPVEKTPEKPIEKPVAEPAQPDHDADQTRVEAQATPGMFTPRRKLAVAVGAVGVVAIAGGIVFGMKGQDAEKKSDAICPSTTCNDPMGLSLNSDARSDALYANIGYIAGGAAVVGAAVLWFTGAPQAMRDDVAVAPVVAPGHVGLSFAGRF